MLIEVEKVLLQERPDVVLVYGDTNTTLAGALAAVKIHIPVAHIEAGLRSYNKRMPEEINRVLTDQCSNILFCPTETAVKNLQKEGFVNIVNNGELVGDSSPLSQSHSRPAIHDLRFVTYGSPLIINVGDVMLDIALEVRKLMKKAGEEKRILERHFLEVKNYILATIHRADNTDNKENLQNIMEALKQITKSGLKIFFPAHPRTKKALGKFILLNDMPKNLSISEPISYMEMVAMESNARMIITDSGGVQKEAYFFKVPCVIPRGETEWTELVKIGWNKVVGVKKVDIINGVLSTLNEDSATKEWTNFYGDGRASEKIVEVLKNYGG
ncbi:MAG TPA: UDP-N-acetyl glucosamine 2-epimerase [bacterium]|nr:UDP-N-acetyl glucosamine 2-epimerase [bacterium]